jgi:hypothetical protein
LFGEEVTHLSTPSAPQIDVHIVDTPEALQDLVRRWKQPGDRL